METFKFNNVHQQEGQTIDNFVMELKKQAKLCEFKCHNCENVFENRMLVDRFVLSINDKKVQEALLKIKNLNLNKAIVIARMLEIGKLYANSLSTLMFN